MTRAYDNWERLVRAALRRQELWQLCHDHSRTTSDGSSSTASAASPGSTSSIPETAAPKTSASTSVSLLNDGSSSAASAASPIPEIAAPNRSASSRVSLLSDRNDRPAGAESNSDKPKMRRKKSIIRLDRWILSRWVSNTFRPCLLF